jgi:hypothetical protein
MEKFAFIRPNFIVLKQFIKNGRFLKVVISNNLVIPPGIQNGGMVEGLDKQLREEIDPVVEIPEVIMNDSDPREIKPEGLFFTQPAIFETETEEIEIEPEVEIIEPVVVTEEVEEDLNIEFQVEEIKSEDATNGEKILNYNQKS